MSTHKFWSEDIAAICTGVFILAFSLFIFVVIPSGEHGPDTGRPAAQEHIVKKDPQAGATPFGHFLKGMVAKRKTWQNNPLDAFRGTNFLTGVLLFLLVAGLLFGLGVKLTGSRIVPFLQGFGVVFFIALLAFVLAAQADFKSIGLGYALWAIVLGLVVSNTFGAPGWLRAGLQHELFIKAGLVLLGAEVLFGKILAIGLPGIFVAWVVTPIVLISTFWFGQRVLKIASRTLNITISADMSVCGVSAAIATAAACRAKKEELTIAIGLSMVFTSVMMVVMPAFIKAVDMPEVLGGAWLGGTIDATGAVVAAGAFLGERALNVAATIKMIQNILIGVIAFGVAVYWTTRVDKTSERTVSAKEIWTRFPKFILGFIGASIFFSLLQQSLDPETSSTLLEKELFGFTKNVRSWFFCLAFASIGLSTNFRELKTRFSGGRPLALYVCGQLLNLGLTLLMAWLMFYKVFPEITSAI